MLRRIEGERPPEWLSGPATTNASAIAPIAPDEELETPQLPRDHPPWLRDALSISSRAKALLLRIKPIVLRVLCFWDHRIRRLAVEGRNVSVDPSGSYRVD